MQKRLENPPGFLSTRQSHTWSQGLEVGQHAVRRAGVDAQGGGTQHRDVTGHLQQHLLGEDPLRPPRPWGTSSIAGGTGRAAGRWARKGKCYETSSHAIALTPVVAASPLRAQSKSWKVNYETFFHMGMAKILQEAGDGSPTACQDLSPSKV